MSAVKDKSGFAPDLDVKRTPDGFWVKLEDVIVEPENNGRACIFTYLGKPSCFEPADVADLLNDEPDDAGSMLISGQQTAVKVWVDGQGRPHLAIGYRRHFALTLARDQGLTIPTPSGKEGRILVTKIPRPKTEADQLRLMAMNLGENLKRRGLSPLDIGDVFRRYIKPAAEGGFGLSKKAAAERLGVSVSHATKCARVFGASPKFRAEWLPKLHRGECKIQEACAAMVVKGEGPTTGGHAGVRKSAVQRAFKQIADRPAPSAELGPGGVTVLLSLMFGESDLVDSTPANVREWYDWANASKAAAVAVAAVATTPPTSKKAPPKAANVPTGKQVAGHKARAPLETNHA